VRDEATNTWGLKVIRVEVRKIDPPTDITEAMSRSSPTGPGTSSLRDPTWSWSWGWTTRPWCRWRRR